MKGQSYIVEFILFFGISFSLFATISYLFYSRSQFLNEQTGDSLSNLINDLVTMNSVKGVNCKACDNATFTQEAPTKIGGFFYQVELKQDSINTTLFASRLISQKEGVLNLNETYSFSGTSDSEDKKVVILINNIGKTVGVQ